MDNPSVEDRDSQPARRRWLWPGIVFAMIGAQMLIVVVYVVIALGDRSFAIEPDYYQKALHWDDHVAQGRANQSLGWTIALEIAAQETAAGQRRVTVVVKDRQGVAVEAARVELAAFHHARAEDRLSAVLEPAGDGLYAVDLRLRRSGLWEFRFVIRRGTDVFTGVEVREVAVPTGGAAWRP